MKIKEETRNRETKLEDLCPFAKICAVDYTKSEECQDKNYVNCAIYQILIKYNKKYLNDKTTRNNE